LLDTPARDAGAAVEAAVRALRSSFHAKISTAEDGNRRICELQRRLIKTGENCPKDSQNENSMKPLIR
jgi:hypothetical protein